MKTKSNSIRVSMIMLTIAGCLVFGMTDGRAQLDYGDAPDSPYPTLLANDGARHVATGPLLGTERDAEGNGQPTIPADGDDIAGATPDDEDGVFFPDILFPGFSDNRVTVTTSGTGPYILNAWMDFNGDGDWADPGEQIFTDTVLALGANPLLFTVPAGVLPNRVYSRWRLATTGGLGYTGAASDGEVEDYCHGSLHGQKWHDRNGDGKRDLLNEEGLNGYRIELRDPDTDELKAFVTTHDHEHDGNLAAINRYTERGVYWMQGVPPGYWILAEKPNPNAFQTFPKNCGADRYFVRANCGVLGRTPPEQPPVCGNVANWVELCPPGEDEMFSVAQLLLQTPPGPPLNGAILTLFASGPTFVNRGTPQNPGPGSAVIQTEMVEMSLSGTHPVIGPFHARAGSDLGLPPSQGQIFEPPTGDDFHVDSFFDVFFEIEVPGVGLQLRNQFAGPGAHVEAIPGITQVPPVGSEYVEEMVPLFNHPAGTPSGFEIIKLVHKPIYGLDFGNKITNAKRKADKRKAIRKLKGDLKKARKKGQRAKVNRLTRLLKKCQRELRRL